MAILFTSESVSEGHPDKVSDQISDAILDEFLRHDPNSKVACETFCTTGLVVIGGEVSSEGEGKVKVDKVARETIRKIGYTKPSYKFDADSCGVMSALHEQSNDIRQGVVEGEGLNKEQGAGDQGMMFGYATNETEEFMPVSLLISHMLLRQLAEVRKGGEYMTYLGPDAKSQVTVRYNTRGTAEKVHTIVISTQHDDFDEEEAMLEVIREDIKELVIKPTIKKLPTPLRRMFGRGWRDRIILHVNPTGKFVIGGPHGDVGLTGRKIIVDTYGGKGAHGGGAFSGKDSSKVDRSAAYAARHIAKNLVAAGVASEALVQVSYAIGLPEPVSLHIDTFRSGKVWMDAKRLKDHQISEIVEGLFDLRPSSIVKRFRLTDPIFSPTSAYGHFGRKPEKKEVEVFYDGEGVVEREGKRYKEVELFPWEKLDRVDDIVKAFGLDEVTTIEEYLEQVKEELK